jgi:hypothetical protein
MVVAAAVVVAVVVVVVIVVVVVAVAVAVAVAAAAAAVRPKSCLDAVEKRMSTVPEIELRFFDRASRSLVTK